MSLCFEKSLMQISSIQVFFLGRRDDKVIINSYTQSRGTGVPTPVMTSGLTVSAFLLVELGFMKLYTSYFTSVLI